MTTTFTDKTSANEADLYDLAPENSAFIRIISKGIVSPHINISGKPLPIAKGCDAGNYIYLPGGNHTFNSQGKNWNYTLKANTVYSLVMESGKPTYMERDLFSEKQRGLLEVFNLTAHKELAIKTTLKEHPVFSKVPPQSNQDRPINPLKIGLSGYSNNKKLFDADPVIFQGGKSSSLFICMIGNKFVTNWSQH